MSIEIRSGQRDQKRNLPGLVNTSEGDDMTAREAIRAEAEDQEARRTSATESFQALGSEPRLGILQELQHGERGVSDLAKAVGLHPVTVRYHLGILLRDGLIEQVRYRREGGIGRPAALYRVRTDAGVEGYPPRRYEMLSEILLRLISQSLDRKALEKALRGAGQTTGQQLLEAIDAEAQVPVWNPGNFVEFFLKRAMSRMGIDVEILAVGEDLVHYRAYGCPFRELAERYTEEICDNLDLGLYEGITQSMGSGVAFERLACIGHGDPNCEYRLRWE